MPQKPGNAKNDALNAVREHGMLNEQLKKIAEELAFNYYSNSFGDDWNAEIVDTNKIFETGGNEFKKRLIDNDRVRNIVIVGAGASYDTYKAIPLGEGLIEEVRRFYENDIITKPFLKEKFNQEANEIRDITGNPDLNFENYLYLLGKFFVTQTNLRDKIRLMTGFRYSISLFNEIVAHLLKHAFVDVVINFNFEETLDQAIKEEIGPENYYNIISDGNCVELEKILVAGRLKVPIYIKPHGTFSHKSTLRFTNRHYFDLPNDIKKMLEDLLSGKRGKKEIQRVNLICVGFALESMEFNKIVNEHLPAGSVIYHIDIKPKKHDSEAKELIDKIYPKFLQRAAKAGRTISNIYVPVNINALPNPATSLPASANLLTSPLGELFSRIWRYQHAFFKAAFRPRSIGRHEIVSYLFYEPPHGIFTKGKTKLTLDDRIAERDYIRENIETNPKYFRNRVLVEIAMVLNRSNGIIDIAEILKSRTGIFYKKYEEFIDIIPRKIKQKNTIYEFVNEFLPSASFEPQAAEQGGSKYLFVLTSAFIEEDFATKKGFTDKVKEMVKHICEHFTKLKVPTNKKVEYAYLIEKTGTFSEYFTSYLTQWYSAKYKKEEGINREKEKGRFERSITIFLRLLTSKFLSDSFKINFLENFDKKVFNGKEYDDNNSVIPQDIIAEGANSYNMLFELFRLFSKSASQHYFVINSASANPVHHLWESFGKRKLIHTVLGLSAEFNYMFTKKEWDILLSVSETGSLLNFLKTLTEADQEQQKRQCESRHIVMICSFETIQQLYPEASTKNELIVKHRNYLSTEFKNEGFIIPDFSLLLVPFNQHNHHVNIFLKSINSEFLNLYNNLKDKFTIVKNPPLADPYFFLSIGSLYNYRQGFSTSIDPLFVGLSDKETTNLYVEQDQDRIISNFVIHIIKAFKFEHFAKERQPWHKNSFLTALQDDMNKNGLEITTDVFLHRLYKMLVP